MESKLREAKRILDSNTWTKHVYFNVAHTHFCLVGALAEVTEGGVVAVESHECEDYRHIAEVIAEQYPERAGRFGDIPTFNDHADTTRADIDLVLEKAIAKADEIV